MLSGPNRMPQDQIAQLFHADLDAGAAAGHLAQVGDVVGHEVDHLALVGVLRDGVRPLVAEQVRHLRAVALGNLAHDGYGLVVGGLQ